MQSGLASPRKSKIDEALELALDARNKLIDSRPDLASLLRACNTISILLGKEEEFKWIKYELNGYPKDASIPDYRNVLGHFLDDSEESIETPVKLRRYAISVPAWRILDLSRSRRGLVLTPSTKQIKDVEREAETTPEEFVVTPTTLKYLLN